MAAMEVSGGVKLVRVADERDGQRLDNFLLGQLKGAPRSLIYKIVRSGQVRINGKRAKPDSRVAGGDEVRIPPVKLDAPGEARPPPKSLLERLAASIVFEDKALLALNKPAGIAAHGGSGRPFVASNRRPRPNGRLTMTPMPRARASGSRRWSAPRLSSAKSTWTKSSACLRIIASKAMYWRSFEVVAPR